MKAAGAAVSTLLRHREVVEDSRHGSAPDPDACEQSLRERIESQSVGVGAGLPHAQREDKTQSDELEFSSPL